MRTSRLLSRLVGAALLALTVVAVSACSSSVTNEHLSASDFAAAMSQPGVVIVDVRTASEFAAGHVAGAINIDVESSDFNQRVAALDKSAKYGLYCHSGRRSGVALEQMRGSGFAHVFDLAGGITAWSAAGKAVVTVR